MVKPFTINYQFAAAAAYSIILRPFRPRHPQVGWASGRQGECRRIDLDPSLPATHVDDQECIKSWATGNPSPPATGSVHIIGVLTR